MSNAFRDRVGRILSEGVVTERLVLMPWKQGDEQAVADFLNADGGAFPRREHNGIYNWSGPFDAQRVAEEVFPAVDQFYADRRCVEVFVRAKTNGRIVGMIDLSVDPTGRNRVGYFILPSERRKGFGLEAYLNFVNHAFKTGLLSDPLYAHTDPANNLSQQFLLKAGFENRGGEVLTNSAGDPTPVIVFTRRLSKGSPFGPSS